MNLIVGFCFADVFINVTQFERVHNCCYTLALLGLPKLKYGRIGLKISIAHNNTASVVLCVWKDISGLFTMKWGSQSVDYGWTDQLKPAYLPTLL